MHWIEHDIWLYYGDSTLDDPDLDANMKPMWDLSSDNDALSFSYFFDNTASRPGAWVGEVNSTRTALSYVYTATGLEFINPSRVLGLAIRNSADPSIVQQEIAQLDWVFSHPAGVSAVIFSGIRYMANVTWPAVMGLQKLQPDTAWITAQNLDAPSASLAWEGFGPVSLSLSGTYNTVRFAIDGSLAVLAGDLAAIEFNTVTLEIDFSNLPTTVVNAEQGVNFFDFTLTDVSSGEYLTCSTPCPVNDTLTIDCENKLVSLSNGERASIILSTDRVDWLDMLPGTIQLKYDDTGTNGVTLVTTHRDRTM